MTVMVGHSYRRYRGTKRTFRDQDLGPFVNQEMNRCIQCYRCVRFYRNYAGGRDFNAFFLRDRVSFGRHDDGTLESEFSGNLVEVCPTGVFTDKTLKLHFTRKWDERTAPSVCVHCGIGCNTIPGERDGLLRRIRTRFNGEVNGYFLCDRGRYGYAFVNSDRRLRSPFVHGGPAGTTTRRMAVERAASFLSTGTRLIGIGSPRASLEANFALRALVGPDRFYSGMAEPEHALVSAILHVLRDGPVRSASLRDVEQSDTVLILGEDVTNTAPMLALALRQSVRRQPMEIALKLHIPEWDDAAVREVTQDAPTSGSPPAPLPEAMARSSTTKGARNGFSRCRKTTPRLFNTLSMTAFKMGGLQRAGEDEEDDGHERDRPLLLSAGGRRDVHAVRLRHARAPRGAPGTIRRRPHAHGADRRARLAWRLPGAAHPAHSHRRHWCGVRRDRPSLSLGLINPEEIE
jgi:hypothetical protein